MNHFSHVTIGVALVLALSFAFGACGKTVGETIDDATITARVKTSLLSDKEVAGLKIDVDTFKGVVTLSGSVRSQAEADRAVGIARSVSGVTDVKSVLQIIPGQDDH